MEQQQKASLKDVLNYEPEQYLSEDELALVKSLTPRHLAVIRKIMLPTINDPQLPIEEMGKDVYFTGLDWMQMSAEHAKVIMQGRQEAVKFILGGLIQLKMLAAGYKESPQQMAQRRLKDSAK